jgi:hypothetical protein
MTEWPGKLQRQGFPLWAQLFPEYSGPLVSSGKDYSLVQSHPTGLRCAHEIVPYAMSMQMWVFKHVRCSADVYAWVKNARMQDGGAPLAKFADSCNASDVRTVLWASAWRTKHRVRLSP